MGNKQSIGKLAGQGKVLLLAVGLTAGSLLALNGAGVLNSGSKPVYAAEQGAAMENTIAVQGIGKLSVAPDIAYVTAGVNVTAKTAKEAQAGAAKRYDAVIKMLKGTYGLADKDLKTTSYYVQPQYKYTEKEGQVLTGYTATHELSVSWRSIAKTGELLDSLGNAGANQISGVSFGTEKTDAYTNDALKKALDNARAKAESLAAAAGRSLGPVVNITENGAQAVPVFREMVQMKATADSAASTSVEPGQVDVQGQLTVVYQLK
ncbi:SIMPL domain-containing protein [Paenibacillus albicereus]|uniref:SIMPL domain-containing protein n=1 Tax=Paenibacillus albicereus TaxID=2726185 RepID=A0A6H2GTB4_9BACL|nr:SIMPL domain-containing protein [Paenibacillus albicereus]QJC50388.1 SIMPL domain-containing protein [Paenibacillus albicereus]